VSLSYRQEPLNEILLDLNDRCGAQISVNADLASGCDITLQKEFKNLEKALEALARTCDLDLQQVNGVFIFRRSRSPAPLTQPPLTQKGRPPSFLYQGLVQEASSGEPVPFATLQIAGRGVSTDEYGRFSFQTSSPTAFLAFRSLGFVESDTLLRFGNELILSLQPNSIDLAEVVVEGVRGKTLSHVGESAGLFQFNDINNQLVPGLGYDLIFNHLRLYPGIMAAGESTSDFVIWGSYAGQNHVLYDGITLFSNWGTYADIGRVNPFMIRDVEVYKGGYGVSVGDRIGGVVQVEGRSGDLKKVRGNVSLTNQLANARLSVPLFNQTSSLQVAGRVTYFNWLDLSAPPESSQQVIVPDYQYSDLNAKFSSNLSPSDKLEISTIASWDSYEAQLRGSIASPFPENINVKSVQYGGSLRYSRSWRGGGLFQVWVSQSFYEPEFSSYFIRRQNARPNLDTLKQGSWSNPVQEFNSRITHTFPAREKHQFEISGAYIHNRVFLESREAELLEDTDQRLGRISMYLQDRIQWTDWFTMELGLKADLPFAQSKVYWQPRAQARFQLSKPWSLNLAWGMYRQFISKNALIDVLGNRTDFWQVAHSEKVPVLKSMHQATGITFSKNRWEWSLEGYYKITRGFSRNFLNRDQSVNLIVGEARAVGLDILIRKQIARHEFLLSYSLGKVLERFALETRTSQFQESPQSQRHEVKAAVMLNFPPFRISATQVYGSGFPSAVQANALRAPIPYWRTDLAAEFGFSVKKMEFQSGISILNLFNRENVRLNQSVSVPEGDVINTLGIPFTPAFYFNLAF